ncbi:peptidoglycan-binding domain-containing protein [Aliisedimentitalea scapharcae]|uniref:Peptidoglycan-binding domain-containing protein n=1 Tax=Aliisedimentitalea scapharcae TaxID=1524259 RepID=A0ABZ2XW41_9RHOB
MFARKLCMSAVAASLVLGPVQRAQANDAAALLGGMIIGGAIVNEVNKSKRRKTTTRRTSTVSSAQRAQNRQVQESLNYFGYNVGAVDGSLGRRSRAGISRYQADMGYTSDGYLDDYEREFLINSHHRAQASIHVAPYNQILASQGTIGVLRTYRNEQLGIATPQGQYQQPYTAASQAPASVPVTAPAPTAAQPQGVLARNQTAALPTFNFTPTEQSAATHCNQINVMTTTNGGLTSAARIGDAEFALSEQFCLARTQVQVDAARVESTIPNMTPAQIEQQCDGLTQVIQPHMGALSTTDPQQVTRQIGVVLQNSGHPIAQLISGGKVCLGVGYRNDNSEMALASALVLSAGGEPAYAELVSHHLRGGFGTQSSSLAAASWMQMTLASLDAGAAPFTGQTPDRIAVLRAALSGGGQAATTIPVFSSSNN